MFLGKTLTVSFRGEKKFFGLCVGEDSFFVVLRTVDMDDVAIAIKHISTVIIHKEVTE